MKKTAGIFLLCMMVFTLAACGQTQGSTASSEAESSPAAETVSRQETGTEAEETESGAEAVTAAETMVETVEETASETAAEAGSAETNASESGAEETGNGTGNILIAYFSWSGNTEAVAGMIQEEVGGDLFEIAPAEPYTEDYDTLLEIAQTEQQEEARPELAAQVENWDSYDIIFVGYPNWWSDAPMAVYTFLESYDFTGKTLIPFNTSASGGFGRSLSGIEESAAGAEILEGFTVTSDQVEGAQEDVSAWISGLGLETGGAE